MPLPQPQATTTVDVTTPESRGDLAKLTMRMFELWDLATTEQLELLGLSATSRAVLARYRRGEPLPPTRDVLDRVGWLLAIHKALRLLYPQNEELRHSWVKRRNQAFGNLTPLQVMTEQGLIGVAKVARYLDFIRGR